MKKNWGVRDIPSQTGKLAVVTGATGGLGYETALGLAQAGAEVIVAGRNDEKGSIALERILRAVPSAKVRYERLDLASLSSVADFAGRMTNDGRALDLLINNAGVMSLPTLQRTVDGFEMQFGTNHLGHFVLTGRLLPMLRMARSPRVVIVSSSAAHQGKMRFDDLQTEHPYKPWRAYTQSKLANQLFLFELQRRNAANGWGLMVNGAHPGYALTDLIANGPGADAFLSKLGKVLSPFFSQPAAAGALPQLYAATGADAIDGGYYGPDGFYELKGPVGIARVAKKAKDVAAAKRLWEVSEELTGLRWGRQ